MKTELLALMAGTLAGAMFYAVDLPVPAPPNVAGLLGIVGLYLGYFWLPKLINHLPGL